MQCVAKINEWARIFIDYDADVSGTMDDYEICGALEAAGFHLNNETIKALLEKFSNRFYQIHFDKFVTCLVLLESVFRKVKSWNTRNLPENMH
ncbi:calpain small subunit 1-like [Sceloporus undulatus]|uniref:calpain small subunit 1-like n=1 Tax=Sceloporus undulatus TaxID=8520 RepID=UPI001C4B359A|nr:calpain small subunit 1-like [Sceloporus undulatus]